MRRTLRLRTGLVISLFGAVFVTGPTGVQASPEVVPSATRESTWQQVTVASWYGRAFAGKRTANGERYDPSELTAAHRSLKLGTHVRVTEMRSGRSVTVRITDRGPYRRGRGIDLSMAAAKHLGILHKGLAKVRLELQPAQPATMPESASLARSTTEWLSQAFLR